ncbi:MAG: response regulator transcription factor [candidate division WOR-3 bacterium]|nr:MAG: response regulator transcription factor [candidate division WOR-3 bacterium]
MSIKILLADDHTLFREGMRSLLQKELNIRIIGEAENGREAVKLALELKPDVIVMDITMPDLNGMEATRKIRKAIPQIKVICLSMHSDRRYVVDMFRAGASGYLIKSCAYKELTDAINIVAANQKYISPQIAHIVIDESIGKQQTKKKAVKSTLTPREREILQLIAEGKNTKYIAHHLYKSTKTVETHRRNIMRKLKAKSVAELTRYAISEGIITLDS